MYDKNLASILGRVKRIKNITSIVQRVFISASILSLSFVISFFIIIIYTDIVITSILIIGLLSLFLLIILQAVFVEIMKKKVKVIDEEVQELIVGPLIRQNPDFKI